MNKTPYGFTPGTQGIYNGDPTWASHAQFVDLYGAYLASALGGIFPTCLVGPYLASAGSTTTIYATIRSSPNTEYHRLQVVYTGAGTITFSNGTDTYDSVLSLDSAQSSQLDYPAVTYTAGPVDVSANGTPRDIEVTLAAAPGNEDYTIAITASASRALTIFSIRIQPMPPLPGDPLA